MSTSINTQNLKKTNNPRQGWDTLLQKMAGSDEKLTNTQKKELYGCIVKSVVGFACLLFGMIVSYYAVTSKNTNNKYYTYMFFIILPILVGIVLATNIFSQSRASSLIIVLVSFVIVLIASVYVLKNNAKSDFVNQVTKYVLIAITLIIFASVYRIAVKYFKNIPGWIGLILKVLFYIPCLVLEFLEQAYHVISSYAMSITGASTTAANAASNAASNAAANAANAASNAANTTFGISQNDKTFFMLLVASILLGWGGYKVYDYFHKLTVRELVTRPLSLSKGVVVAKNDVMKVPRMYSTKDIINPSDYSDPDASFNHNYSIDMWIYVNKHIENIQPILKYGEDDTSLIGKPTITFGGSGTKPFRLYYTNYNANRYFEFDMPLQKWNYLVVSYDNNRVTLYVNGEIIFTQELTVTNDDGIIVSSIPTYTLTDVIKVGGGTELYGSIRNVNYYTRPMSLREISTTMLITPQS
jgi:putative effector of murein hydrolase LrgA (UPF0299 family)